MKALRFALCATILFALAPFAGASLVSTSGLTVFTPPAGTTVGNDFLLNTGQSQVIFAERQGVTLTSPLATDIGIIPAGTTVDSFFVALNAPASQGNVTANTSATFSSPVLGVVFLDRSANFAGTDFLGLATLKYQESPAFCFFCGFEAGDTAMISGNTVNFHNVFNEPGDFARVITLAPSAVPEPSSLILLACGLAGLPAALRRRK